MKVIHIDVNRKGGFSHAKLLLVARRFPELRFAITDKQADQEEREMLAQLFSVKESELC